MLVTGEAVHAWGRKADEESLHLALSWVVNPRLLFKKSVVFKDLQDVF